MVRIRAVAAELGNLLQLHFDRHATLMVVDTECRFALNGRDINEQYLRRRNREVGRCALEQPHYRGILVATLARYQSHPGSNPTQLYLRRLFLGEGRQRFPSHGVRH